MSSRTHVAQFLAHKLIDADTSERSVIIAQTASWLKFHGQTKSVNHLVQDVALALADTGYLYAKVTTARELTPKQKTMIESFIARTFSASYVEAEYHIDRALIGGIKIETAHGTLDDSVQGKLNRMLENIG